MEWKIDSIQDFFNQLWSFVTDKHNQGVYNTICLAVVLTLPLLVLLTAVLVCCHCCCCRHANSCCCCCCGDTATTSRLETKKKKNSSNNEDLWISVKTVPMTPERVALTVV
uniref:KIAA0040 n=1 Tax=Oryzias sinensis TaxID=183150 RepID=A0A8C7YHL3_9TELE